MLMNTANFELEEVIHNIIVIAVAQIKKTYEIYHNPECHSQVSVSHNAGFLGVHKQMFWVRVPS